MSVSNSISEKAEQLVDGILRNLQHSIRRVVNIYDDGNEALDGVIMPEAMKAIEAAGLSYVTNKEISAEQLYTGERRNLCRLVNLPHDKWETVLNILATCYAGKHKAAIYIKPGDYIDIPVAVEQANIERCNFPSIRAESARMVVTHVFSDKIILNFEDVISYAPMNFRDTNEGGFPATALAEYLNTKFLDSVFAKIKQFLVPNIDGLLVSVPTRYEVFGDGPVRTNWGDTVRHEYFKKCTNRIKVGIDDKDDTKYWWNYDPYSTNAAYFCYVSGGGTVSGSIASLTGGGVSPVICVSENPAP